MYQKLQNFNAHNFNTLCQYIQFQIDYKSRVESMVKVERDSLDALEKQGRDQINSYDRFKTELEGLVLFCCAYSCNIHMAK